MATRPRRPPRPRASRRGRGGRCTRRPGRRRRTRRTRSRPRSRGSGRPPRVPPPRSDGSLDLGEVDRVRDEGRAVRERAIGACTPSGGRGRAPCRRRAAGRRSPSRAPPVSQRSIMWAARRPSPTARVMSVGPFTTSPAAKTYGTAVWQDVASACERAVRVGRDAARECTGVGRHADRPDDDLAAGSRTRCPGRARVGGARTRPARRASCGCSAGRSPLPGRRRGPRPGRPGRLKATPSRSASSASTWWAGISSPAAPVGDRDGRRAQAASRPRRVHRDVAAADHDDPLAGQVDRLAELHLAQEVGAAEHAEAILAGDAEAGRARGARRQEHGVEAVLLEGGQVADRAVRGDLDADRP